MRKLLFGLIFCAACIAGSAHADLQSRLAGVNEGFAKIFAFLANDFTQGAFEVTRYAENEDRVLAVRFNGFLRKTGPQKPIAVELAELSYEYGDGQAPKTVVKGGVNLDISTVAGVTPEIFDGVVLDIERTVQSLAAQYLADYGEAVQASAVVEEKSLDASGHYQSIKAKISLKFDLSRLPETKRENEVIFTSVDVTVDVQLKTGIHIEAELISNTGFAGFQKDQKGLKDLFKDLMEQNHDAWSQVERGLFDLNLTLDRFAHEN